MNVQLVVDGQTYQLVQGEDYFLDTNTQTVKLTAKISEQVRAWNEQQKNVKIVIGYASNTSVAWNITVA